MFYLFQMYIYNVYGSVDYAHTVGMYFHECFRQLLFTLSQVELKIENIFLIISLIEMVLLSILNMCFCG